MALFLFVIFIRHYTFTLFLHKKYQIKQTEISQLETNNEDLLKRKITVKTAATIKTAAQYRTS